MCIYGAFVVIFKDDSRKEIFLVRRSDYKVWDLMGGGMEKNEDFKTAAIREAMEETGFKIKITRLIGVYDFWNQAGVKTLVTHLYEGRVISGTFKPEFPGCLGRWFSINSLPIDMTKINRDKISDAINFAGQPFEKNLSEEKIIDNVRLLFLHPISALKFLTRNLRKS